MVHLGIGEVLIAGRAERDVGRKEVGPVASTVIRVDAVVQQRHTVTDGIADEPGLGGWNAGVPTEVFEDGRVERLLLQALRGGRAPLQQGVQSTVVAGVHRAHLAE